LSTAKLGGIVCPEVINFIFKWAKYELIHSNPSVSHTLDSSPYTGEPLENDFVNALKEAANAASFTRKKSS